MKFTYTLCAFAFVGVSVAYPVDVRSNTVSSLSSVNSLVETATNDPNSVLDDIKTDATAKAAATNGGSSTNTKVTAASVKQAAANFAKDANTVSASINTMGSTTDSKTLKSLATTAFNEVSFCNGPLTTNKN